MALTLVVTTAVIHPADLNQLVNVLQRSAGQSEVGHYINIGACYATGATLGVYYATQSRGTTPASNSVDASIVAATGVGAPSTNHMDAYCIQISAVSTAAGLNVGCGGLITMNY